jgi:hypothetical protein
MCYYCHGDHPQHDPNCPEKAELAVQKAAKETWQQGYDDGFGGRDSESQDLTYRLGWVRGDSDADYRENVFE